MTIIMAMSNTEVKNYIYSDIIGEGSDNEEKPSDGNNK